MNTVFRGVLAVMLAVLASFVVIGILESLGHVVYPPPPGLDMHDHAAMASSMKSMPTGALVSVLLAWAGGTFVGAWVAAKLAPTHKVAFGLGMGVLFLLLTVVIMVMIPHPTRMWVLGLAEFLPVAYLGAWLATRPTSRSVSSV